MDEPVILVANRGPVQFRRADDRREADRGAGGLVTALTHLAAHLEEATWICAALSEEDVAVAREEPDGFPLEGTRPTVRMVELDPEEQRRYVLVVNSIFDGMNLVAKEPVLVNEAGGVLALSENTGAHDELGAFALSLHPFDIQQQADAMYAALIMPTDERRARRAACAAIVRENDVTKWLKR